MRMQKSFSMMLCQAPQFAPETDEIFRPSAQFVILHWFCRQETYDRMVEALTRMR